MSRAYFSPNGFGRSSAETKLAAAMKLIAARTLTLRSNSVQYGMAFHQDRVTEKGKDRRDQTPHAFEEAQSASYWCSSRNWLFAAPQVGKRSDSGQRHGASNRPRQCGRRFTVAHW